MKHVVSFSYGMGSFAEAKSCCEKFGVENTLMLSADTKMEDEDAYRFGSDVSNFLGCEWIVVADGRTPFEVFKDERFMGNTRKDPCSKILKRKLLKKTVKQMFKPDQVNVHLGIDYSECHRMIDVVEKSAPYIYRSTLIEDGRIIHKSFSEQFGIKRPRLYDWGLGHNNCGGFCVKAGLGHYKALFNANPDRYKEFEEKELEVYVHIGGTYPFLKKQTKGVKERLTLKDYRLRFLETNLVTEEESLEFGGCGCAI